MVAESVGLVPDPNQAMQVLWLVPLLPLVGAVINLFFGKRLGKAAGWLAVVMMALSFAVAVLAVKGLIDAPEGERLYLKHLSDWISVGSLQRELRPAARRAVGHDDPGGDRASGP